MPKCPFCGEVPYLTECPSYYAHLESCSKSASNAYHKILNNSPGDVVKSKKDFVLTYQDQISNKAPKYSESTGSKNLVVNITNNITNNITYNNFIYQDYPRTNLTTSLLNMISNTDIKQIKSVDQLNEIIHYALDSDNFYIERCIQGSDKRAKSQALSFMADLVKKTREKMTKEAGNRPEILEIIEGAKEYEKEMLDEKKLLGC